MAQSSTATVTASAYDCTGLGSPGLLGEVGADCTPSSANFTFYLVGDGTDDSWNLVADGNGSATVPVGNYEVYESVSGTMFNLSVPESGTSFAFGFPAAAPVPPPSAPPPSAPAPSAETATLMVNTYACTGVVGAPIALVDIGPDCTPISTNVDFYLWGDGTDASWNLTTSASGPVSIDLQVGGYEVVNTSSWETLGAQVPSGGATLSIGYASVAVPAPAPDPVAETATLTVTTYECTGVVGAPIALVDIGPDCTQIGTNLDFYLWGDGTDDSWNLTTSASGPVSIDLQVGGYEVVNTSTWATLGAQLPSGGATLSIGYAAEAAPAPVPAPETATLTVNTYACTGVTGAPIALVDIGPDCTQIGTNLDFYLWGDGTDDSWNLTTSASGPVSIDLQVGGYEIVDTTSWATIGAQLPSGGATLSIGYASVAPPVVETGMLTIDVYSCTGVTGNAIVLYDIGPDCTQISTTLDFYLWGDGTDDHWTVTTSATSAVTVELPVGDYVVVDTMTWLQVDGSVTTSGGTLSIGLPATYVQSANMATP